MKGESFRVEEVGFAGCEVGFLATGVRPVASEVRLGRSDGCSMASEVCVEGSDGCLGSCSTMGCVGGMSDCIMSLGS